jgi:putative redox protein
VRVERVALGRYRAVNRRGGTIEIGDGDDGDFSAIELLLAAIGACTAPDVDHVTSRRAEPVRFEITVDGDKISGADGNAMEHLRVTFDLEFPDGPDGDEARRRLPQAVAQSHDRLCTVSRTVEAGRRIETRIL